MRTIVYADGGCDPNPGPGGWGVVIQAPDGTVELCGGDPQSTNNRMELTAAIRALEHFPEGAAIEMRCDSQYVVKSVTEWIRGWKLKGWRTTTGPVKNVELMQRLDELAARRDVRWVWVKGHAGEAGNERADRLAAQGRRQGLGLPPRADIAPARAPAAPPAAAPAPTALPEPAPRGTSIPVEGGLGLRLARAAKQAGTTPQAYADEVLRLAVDLGPEGLALLREAKARKAPAA
ncbi:ribonuclease HI [Methylobacterium platani]|uniref:Ribonuclease H n=2 Tax=Methylobacterium platani TaxID=427683 RepID=A0A179S515_9HYPH|nr:ribonuclease HI [Methylobacterium platani]KMO18992.1 ribonuclease H [Methylobacterium platani JCM 14648]OAS22027.1 ribonuclease HI [Methylobacterium platani]